MSTIAEAFIETLSQLGVSRIFGIPGGPWLPYLEVMRRKGMEYVLVANEASAGIMADVTARVTGRIGVCQSTFGAGATNLSTGVGCAYLDRSPILALTAEHSDAMLQRTTQMNIDHQTLFTPITKSTVRLDRKNPVETICGAAQIALSEVPGPVHVGMPADLAGITGDENPSFEFPGPSSLPSPDEKLLQKAGRILQRAEKPLLAVGLTAARMRLHERLARLLEKHRFPVVLTPMAKGMLSEDHPCYAGVLFHALSHHLADIHGQADLIIGIGYDPVEFNYEEWVPHVPLVHLDTSPTDLDARYEIACNVVGDLSESIDYLTKLTPSETKWDFEALAHSRKVMFEALRPQGGGFGPKAALTVLREALPREGIMACDVGAHTHLIGQLWPTPSPGLLLMTNGWSSMGFGVPAAMAAKLCLPERPVVCVTGDGGFLMMAGEVVTARRLGLNVVFVVLADRELSLMRVKQEHKRYEEYSTRLYEDGLFSSRAFFGVRVLTARDASEMKESLRKALSAQSPMIIEAIVDGSEYSELVAKEFK